MYELIQLLSESLIWFAVLGFIYLMSKLLLDHFHVRR